MHSDDVLVCSLSPDDNGSFDSRCRHRRRRRIRNDEAEELTLRLCVTALRSSKVEVRTTTASKQCFILSAPIERCCDAARWKPLENDKEIEINYAMMNPFIPSFSSSTLH